ncbi:hypothetical protein BHYA_0204g00090 [Botrytis hyacinthi]|uniref:Uncharacterized protein n=1 Tax=Botrytis hyacinthi TaxID=278943 RepID=A0A4Z1GIK2_9HELO|nr:hypothetical protein BHYA_0204g00090 [Botrytis hyacinthi]
MATPSKSPIRQFRGENDNKGIGTKEEEKEVVQETGDHSIEVASKIDQQVSKDSPDAIATARTTFIIGASSSSGSSLRSNYGASSRSNYGSSSRSNYGSSSRSNYGSSSRSNYGSNSRSNARSSPRSRFSVGSSASHIASLRASPKKRKYRKIRSVLKAIKEYWKPTPNPPLAINMAIRRATGSVATSSSAETAEKEYTRSESNQRVLEAIRQPSTIVGTGTSSATTSNTSLSAIPSATKAEKKEISFKSDPRLLEASPTLIARQTEDQDQNPYAGGGDEYMQMQVVENARNDTHVAPEEGPFASLNLLSVSSSSTMMMMETASSTSASISHNDLPSNSRTTTTTILSASISALDIRKFESGSDRSSQASIVTIGSIPPVQFLPNESNSYTQGDRVAPGSLRMMVAVFARPASGEIANTSNGYRPLLVDSIMDFADVGSQTNLRGAVSILQQPNDGHSDTEEEEDKESSSGSSCEAHEENSEKGETSSSDDDCPGPGSGNRRQRAPQDRQDENDSGFEGSYDSNSGNENGIEDKEQPDQSDIVTRSAQETNNKSRHTLTTLETDNNIEELHADCWGLNSLGGKGQKNRKRRGDTTSVFFGVGFRSLSLGVAAYASNGKRRKIGENSEKKAEHVEMDDTDDADDEDSDSGMNDEGSACNPSFYGFKKLLVNWDRLECSRRY